MNISYLLNLILFNIKKSVSEFAVVSVYIEKRPLVFLDYKSHFTHKFIMSGYMGYFLIITPPTLLKSSRVIQVISGCHNYNLRCP